MQMTPSSYTGFGRPAGPRRLTMAGRAPQPTAARGRWGCAAAAWHAAGGLPARLLAEAAAADPQRIRRFRFAHLAEDLAGLACEEAALSRSSRTSAEHDRWLLRHGPFPRRCSPNCRDHDWTLLVQDVDKWDADVAALLPAFDFLPRWRIDDVMVSFAAPRRFGRRACRPVRRVPAAGAGTSPVADRRIRGLGKGSPPIHFRLDTRTEAAATLHARRTNGCSSPATCSTCRPACRATASPRTPA